MKTRRRSLKRGKSHKMWKESSGWKRCMFETVEVCTKATMACECLHKQKVKVKLINNLILDREKENLVVDPVSEDFQTCCHIE